MANWRRTYEHDTTPTSSSHRRFRLGRAGQPVSEERLRRRPGKKRVLAILGDAYHAVAPLDAALVGRLRKIGYEAVTIMDYSVPWDDFGKYDLIILSREGREYVTYYRERDGNPPNNGQARWLTPAQEQKFEDYVNAGGRLFLYHDGFGAYPKGNGVSRVAKAYFIRHPAIVSINVSPTGKMTELTQGITPFTVADEEYQVEMDESSDLRVHGKPFPGARTGGPGMGPHLWQGESGRLHPRSQPRNHLSSHGPALHSEYYRLAGHMKNYFLIVILLASCAGSGFWRAFAQSAAPVKVEIRKENGEFRLYRGGRPYYVKGAVYGGDPNGKFPLRDLAARGANSVRSRGSRVLDEAQRLGMSVLVNVPMRMESVHKFDYSNEQAVREQFEQAKKLVLEFKDHPAVLMWAIGNELSVGYKNKKVWNAVNDVARMIHEVDPNHPDPDGHRRRVDQFGRYQGNPAALPGPRPARHQLLQGRRGSAGQDPRQRVGQALPHHRMGAVRRLAGAADGMEGLD